jgi:hypothetical protein
MVSRDLVPMTRECARVAGAGKALRFVNCGDLVDI